MKNLHPPTPELILKILREVEFKDRFTACSVHERAGVKTASIYSMKELLVFLNNKMPFIDFNKLELWIRTVITDEHLADRLKSIIPEEKSDHDKCHRIRELIRMRIAQCM